jgi:hypothetical protein
VRLTAKTDTSVTEPSTNSSAKVPKMAIAPITSGRAAATRLEKASTSSSRVSGTAIASAMARLRVTAPLTSRFWAASPPASTVISGVPRV